MRFVMYTPDPKDDRDNRSNQMNPNNDAYDSSRGVSPDDDCDHEKLCDSDD